MNILIIAATSPEILPAIEFLQLQNFSLGKNRFSFLISGIGGIATAYSLTKSINNQRPEYIIQAGIAGSFHDTLPPGLVVCVLEELIGDMGAEEGNEFRDIFDLGLMDENELPFTRKILKNPFVNSQSAYGLQGVRSIGVNEITTRSERIELLRKKINPDIESMEGASFHYVCLQEKIPFLQLRAISNYAGERNKANWHMGKAIENLNKKLIEIISSFA